MSLLKKLILEMGPYGGVIGLDKVDALKNQPSKVALPFQRYMMQRSAAEGEEESDTEDYGSVYDMIRDGELSKEEFISMMTSHEDLDGVEDPLPSEHDDQEGIELDKPISDEDLGDHEYR